MSKILGILKKYRMFAVQQLHIRTEDSVRFFRITIKRSFSQFISHFGVLCGCCKPRGLRPFYINLFVIILLMQQPVENYNTANDSNCNVTPNGAKTETQIKHLTDALISWDDPTKYADTLEILYGCYQSCDIADNPDNRSKTWFHFLELRNFLTKLQMFNPRSK